MIAIQLRKGEPLIRKGETSKAIYIVLKGSVYIQTRYNQITMGMGSVLGFMVGSAQEYICDYVAAEDALIASYRYETPNDYKTIFQEQPKYCYAFLHAAIRQYKIFCDAYQALKDAAMELSVFVNRQNSEYEHLCAQNTYETKTVEVCELCELDEPEHIHKWEFGYFRDLGEIPEKALRYFYSDKEDMTIGVLVQIAEMMGRLVANMDAVQEYMKKSKEMLISEDEDLLELWYDLAAKLALDGKDTSFADSKVRELELFLKRTGFYSEDKIAERMQYYRSVDFRKYAADHKQAQTFIEENATGEIAEVMTKEDVLRTDFVKYIMEYAGYGAPAIAECKVLVQEYAEIAEVQDYTPEMQKTRKNLTKLFYEIYEKAFMRAVNARSISVVMKLFFNFGVLDLKLAGEEHVDALMAFNELLDTQWLDQKKRDEEGESFSHVYSAYQWLSLVFRGEKEPSKNEFDVDYAGHLLELRKNKEITREQETKLKHDQVKKVEFELHNMFMTNNRITYGRITTFCPVLHAKEFVRSMEQLMVTFTKVNAAIDDIRKLDYSCFYREVFFSAPQHGIERTEIMKEVLPDVILMPNIGSRAMMWQETAGVKRDTPARFIFPIMTSAELSDMMLETVGRYRWEICRKIMGVHWNDIREKSLTSEFYDYIQFYRKNRDLSQQAKEKIKTELVHAKNNFREVFVADYVSWMKYESQGSFRLNKVARRIISEYIPFNRAVCRRLEDNPMFKELFTKQSVMIGRKREKERVLFDRYTAAGGVMTPELEAHMAFYDM